MGIGNVVMGNMPSSYMCRSAVTSPETPMIAAQTSSAWPCRIWSLECCVTMMGGMEGWRNGGGSQSRAILI